MNLQAANKMIHKFGLIPAGYYNPLDDRKFYEAGVNVLCSTRSVGKTTNFLIAGLCLYCIDKTQTIYMRASDEQIRPKNVRQIFNVIIERGYIEDITNGAYNSVTQISRYWYLCKVEDGKVVDKDSDAFMVMVALNENDELCSSLNTPKGDWVVFDEFISHQNKYQKDEFFIFMDLLKTILRDRTDAHVCMLANTVDPESRYFYEMEIRDFLEYVENDKTDVLTTRLGTKISFRVMTAGIQLHTLKKASFLKFFGFSHPRMASITGVGELFTFARYPHLNCELDEVEYLARNIYCEYMRSKYLAIDFIYNRKTERTMLHIHKSKQPWRDDAVVIVAGTPEDKNELTWDSRLGKKILKMRQSGLATYGTNADGSLFDKITQAPKLETR